MIKILSVVVMLTAILFGGHGESEAWALDDVEEKQNVQQVKEKAEQGDAEAQHNLAVMYAEGMGVPQDDSEAVKWSLKASRQGIIRAQSFL